MLSEMLSVRDFCKRFGISVSSYYTLKRNGENPAETHIGGRRLVSQTAAEEWQKGREVAQAKPPAPPAQPLLTSNRRPQLHSAQ